VYGSIEQRLTRKKLHGIRTQVRVRHADEVSTPFLVNRERQHVLDVLETERSQGETGSIDRLR
jgi:hypothetical protein